MKLSEFGDNFPSNLLDKLTKNQKQFFFEEGMIYQNRRATMLL